MAYKICVPIDFSQISLTLLKAAKLLAETFEGEIEVIHVSPFTLETDHFYGTYLPILGYSEDKKLELEKAHVKMIEELLEKCELSSEQVRSQLLYGDPVKVICEHQKTSQADLVLVGTKGHGALERMVLGSVTQGLISHLECSLLAVKDADFLNIEKIDYLSDFSSVDDMAVAWINRYASKTPVDLDVHHVVSPRSALDMVDSDQFNELGSLIERATMVATDMADKLCGRFDCRNVSPQIYKTTHSDIAKILETPLKKAHSQLIVMGTHGRTGPGKWLLGSVAEVLLRRIDESLLVLKSKGKGA